MMQNSNLIICAMINNDQCFAPMMKTNMSGNTITQCHLLHITSAGPVPVRICPLNG